MRRTLRRGCLLKSWVTPKAFPWAAIFAKTPAQKVPTFLVGAMKDPLSGNLDRIQIIKGWVDGKGELHPRRFMTSLGPTGASPLDTEIGSSVGSTVDVDNAIWTNTIGSPELIAVWKDPDFDPALRAFYYSRVIEISTPRWTAYDQKRFGIKMPKDVPMTVQERAYTSPIWYTPSP